MHRVGLIVPHGFQLLSLAPMTAFEMTGFWTCEAASGRFLTMTFICCRNTAVPFDLPAV